MPIGITFNDEKHSYRDFGLRIISVNIGLPEVKRALLTYRAPMVTLI